MTDSYVSYISRRGRIVAATCTTAGKTEFYRDAVGSVVMTTNYNSPIGKSQRFAAYGKELTPNSYYSNYRMGWVGSMGYRATQLPHAEVYIRARHYSTTDSRWTTRDPLWPEESSFGYVGARPLILFDPDGNSGKQACSFKAPTWWPACYIVGDLSHCEKRTGDYGHSYGKTGNLFEQCASCVSASICDLIAAGNAEGKLGTGSVGGVISPILSRCLDCMGDCMYDHWRKKNTPGWRNAHNACSKSGTNSKKCCIASVNAEQNGYNLCAAQCGCNYMNLLPVQLRIIFALDVLKCCDK